MEIPNYRGRYFLDTSSITEIKRLTSQSSLVKGVTTNPGIMVREGIDPKAIFSTIKKICEIIPDKDISVELMNSRDSIPNLVNEAQRYASINPFIVIKVPMLPEDPQKTDAVVTQLAKRNIRVNITVLMNSHSMQLAADMAAQCRYPSYISLFWARSIEEKIRREDPQFVSLYEEKGLSALGPALKSDVSPSTILEYALGYLRQSRYDNIKTIVGSIRDIDSIVEAVRIGTDFITIPPKLWEPYLQHLYRGAFSQRATETLGEFDKAGQQLQNSMKLSVL